MDTIDNGQFTYQASNQIYQTLNPGTTTSSTTSSTSTTSTTSNFCDNKPAGMYCVDSIHFEYCPSGDEMACPNGTTCHQEGNYISCQ